MQTLAFDCCHSASITRGRPTAAFSRDPDLQEIIRAVPELYYRVPDDLDEEIWGAKRALTVSPALKDTGSGAYVLFSACKSTEFAIERRDGGIFTNALLNVLNNFGPNEILCSQIIERLQIIQGLVTNGFSSSLY